MRKSTLRAVGLAEARHLRRPRARAAASPASTAACRRSRRGTRVPPRGRHQLAVDAGHRAREGAAGVAEQLRLHQLVGDRGAVDRRRSGPRARRPARGRARAISSLPVPVSPVSSTGMLRARGAPRPGAASRAPPRSRATMPGVSGGAASGARQLARAARRARSSAGARAATARRRRRRRPRRARAAAAHRRRCAQPDPRGRRRAARGGRGRRVVRGRHHAGAPALAGQHDAGRRAAPAAGAAAGRPAASAIGMT